MNRTCKMGQMGRLFQEKMLLSKKVDFQDFFKNDIL